MGLLNVEAKPPPMPAVAARPGLQYSGGMVVLNADTPMPAASSPDNLVERIKLAQSRSTEWQIQWSNYVMRHRGTSKRDPSGYDVDFLRQALQDLGEPEPPDPVVVQRVKEFQKSPGGLERWAGYVKNNGGGKCDPNLRQNPYLIKALDTLLKEDGGFGYTASDVESAALTAATIPTASLVKR